ncbi:uncharacterized protein LOC105787068 [Gossypium raimondii]|uniref:uncharacterized protein LOC105787068 n=1 Tax=Gossypium raimondii TaxID=29730 RepID=UPI00063AC081|nr:uncharacterized protein LOC105787068 [Gossypium raimondii]
MRESETIKQYSGRIMAIVNSIRLLGEYFSESRVVEKVITTLLDKFESKISSLKNSRDLSAISLFELINSLYALEQMRANGQEEHPEGAFQAKAKEGSGSNYKGKKPWLDKREKLRRDAVDSGCTHHIAADEKLFKDIDRSFTSKIRIGNGNPIEAKGRGNVVINTWSDSHGQELVTITLTDRCFMLDVNQLENKAYTSLIDNAGRWHKRLGHANYKSLDLLHKLNLVEDMSKVEVKNTVCEVCQLGKQARLLFPVNKAWRARDKLQLVHSNVCGPMKTPSLNDSKYFILFIDDLTRFCWVYFLKQKSEVFEAFSKFKALAENQTGCKIKALRSDNGTEFLSERF